MQAKPGIYQHYKGGRYEVLGIAKHSESLEDLVIYRALYKNSISELWARPLSNFLDPVTLDGKKTERFKYLGPREV
jgi:hypothetical protein